MFGKVKIIFEMCSDGLLFIVNQNVQNQIPISLMICENLITD